MNPNHVLKVDPQYRTEHQVCSLLLWRILAREDGKFTQFEIDLAGSLLKSDVVWDENVEATLQVISGIQTLGVDVLQECYAALTFK